MTGATFFRVLPIALLLICMPSQALERILSFHSDIHIAPDGEMTVEETIRVVAEGQKIQRGIYREFPTRYKDRYGNRYTVAFQVLEVTRDGEPESWHKKRRANGMRIYVGKSNTYLDTGVYTYRFLYRTNRQIGFFSNRDELYWNVTGNGWSFPIEQASASVTLPVSVDPADITISGYTGPMGSKATDFSGAAVAGGGYWKALAPLASGEGLTLVLGWPKGVIAEPSDLERVLYALKDNLGLTLSLLGFIGSALYLLLMWHRNGRDPEEGVVFPHYEPPTGYSPASARYIRRMGYDDKTLSAAIINLAVKGHLSIDHDSKKYTLTRESSSAKLAPGEKTLLNSLFNKGTALEMENNNHWQVSAAREAHKLALKKDYRNKYFKTNTVLLLPSILWSLAMLIGILVTASFVPLVIVIYISNIFVHMLFVYLLKAPSPQGRRLMDKLEGFRLYLEVAEKDDLNLRHPPDMTPQLFEKYLPFAIALGVEQDWAEQFSKIFSHLQAQGKGEYSPNWYRGNFNHNRMSLFSDSVGSDFSSAISSSASPPGSSSGGGGGGFSGGGGGGGGGGGW